MDESAIIKYLNNELSLDEIVELEKWIHESPANEECFQAYLAAWNHKYNHPQTFNSYAAQKKLRFDRPRQKGWRTPALISAGVLVVAVIAFLVTSHFSNFNSGNHLVRSNPAGQRSSFPLPDGSQVWLNSESSLDFPMKFEQDERTVVLTGEAFFEIKKDSERPFMVNLPGKGFIRVLGTQFNVNTTSNISVVTVTEGTVALSNSNSNQIILNQNEQGLLERKNLSKRTVTDTYAAVAWKNNEIIFDNLELNNVALELEQWFGQPIEISGGGSCHIKGSFRDVSLDHVIRVVAESVSGRYLIENDTIKIIGAKCPNGRKPGGGPASDGPID